MENQAPLDNDFSTHFGLTNEIRSYLSETAKWANFLAIVGFIGLGFMVLAGLFMGVAFTAMAGDIPEAAMPFPPILFSGIYILMAAVLFFPVLYMYRFAKHMKTALAADDQVALTDSFMNLKAAYKFYGVLTIVLLGIYALAFVGGIFAAALL